MEPIWDSGFSSPLHLGLPCVHLSRRGQRKDVKEPGKEGPGQDGLPILDGPGTWSEEAGGYWAWEVVEDVSSDGVIKAHYSLVFNFTIRMNISLEL